MTSLRYLDEPYNFKAVSKVVELKLQEPGYAILLDETIFYPQGGGQPADTGKLSSEKGTFTVADTRMDENGLVWHLGAFDRGFFENDETVVMDLDQAKRLLNMRLHSAGHLVDCVVEMLNLNLTPSKGFHFPEGPYVEYHGVLEDPASLVPEMNRSIEELISRDLPVEIRNLSPEEAKIKGHIAPPGKQVRLVNFTGFNACGCGGTHISSAAEISSIRIRKIKSKKGNTRISYSIE